MKGENEADIFSSEELEEVEKCNCNTKMINNYCSTEENCENFLYKYGDINYLSFNTILLQSKLDEINEEWRTGFGTEEEEEDWFKKRDKKVSFKEESSLVSLLEYQREEIEEEEDKIETFFVSSSSSASGSGSNMEEFILQKQKALPLQKIVLESIDEDGSDDEEESYYNQIGSGRRNFSIEAIGVAVAINKPHSKDGELKDGINPSNKSDSSIQCHLKSDEDEINEIQFEEDSKKDIKTELRRRRIRRMSRIEGVNNEFCERFKKIEISEEDGHADGGDKGLSQIENHLSSLLSIIFDDQNIELLNRLQETQIISEVKRKVEKNQIKLETLQKIFNSDFLRLLLKEKEKESVSSTESTHISNNNNNNNKDDRERPATAPFDFNFSQKDKIIEKILQNFNSPAGRIGGGGGRQFSTIGVSRPKSALRKSSNSTLIDRPNSSPVTNSLGQIQIQRKVGSYGSGSLIKGNLRKEQFLEKEDFLMEGGIKAESVKVSQREVKMSKWPSKAGNLSEQNKSKIIKDGERCKSAALEHSRHSSREKDKKRPNSTSTSTGAILKRNSSKSPEKLKKNMGCSENEDDLEKEMRLRERNFQMWLEKKKLLAQQNGKKNSGENSNFNFPVTNSPFANRRHFNGRMGKNIDNCKIDRKCLNAIEKNPRLMSTYKVYKFGGQRSIAENRDQKNIN